MNNKIHDVEKDILLNFLKTKNYININKIDDIYYSDIQTEEYILFYFKYKSHKFKDRINRKNLIEF